MPNLKIDLEFTNETYIIGISSNEKIYRLCWQFNHFLNFELKYSHLHLSNDVANEGFATYKTTHLEEHTLYLVANKYLHHYILAKYKLFDFFVICDTLDEDELDELCKAINQLESVNTAKIIEITSPKEVELFYIEE